MDHTSLRQSLLSLFHTQKLAVLATYGDGQPYCSLMAFAATEDLRHVVVATKRQTQKYANIRQHPRLSLLVDNRTNQAGDFQQALAITILAAASEPAPAEYNLFLDLYLDKHPYMSGFCQSPDCALIKLTVDRYLVVSFLQKSPDSKEDYAEVRELQP